MICRSLFLVVLAVGPGVSIASAADRPVRALGDLTGPWQLFVDDYLVAEKTNVVRAYHPFTKYAGNPVIGDNFKDDPPRSVTSRCYVRHDNDVFRMWYSYGCPNYEIWYAESTDGIVWEKSPLNPVLAASPGPAWDDDIVAYPEVQIVDGVYRLWFCGNGFGSVGYAEGILESGINLECRSGDGPEPDERWRDWQPIVQG